MPETGLSPEEEKRRKERNRAIGLSLAAFVVIVFFVTMLKISGTLGGGAS